MADMTRETAQMLNELMLAMGRQLDESVAAVQQRESDEVYRKYRRTAGELLGTMLMEVLNPIYAQYPDLEPEMLKKPGHSSDKTRPFKATHRIHLRGEAAVEVMLYEPTGGIAHTLVQWNAFQRGEGLQGPFWWCLKRRWWRDNESLGGDEVEVIP